MFGWITGDVLGKNYDLSLVICSDKISKHNVLAYALSRNSGEIFLNPSRRGNNSLTYLFIHACLHLVGHRHNSIMASLEKKLFHKYSTI